MTTTPPTPQRGKPSEVEVSSLGLRLRITSLLESDLDACRIEGHRQVERLVGKGTPIPGDHPLRAQLLDRAISRSIVARAVEVVAPDGSIARFAPRVEDLGAWPPDVVDALVRLYEEHLEREAGASRPDPALASQTVEAILALDEGDESFADYDARGCAVIARALSNELRALLASDRPAADLEALRERIAERRKPLVIETTAQGIPSADEASP